MERTHAAEKSVLRRRQEEARRRAEGQVTRAEFVEATEQLLSEIVRVPGDEQQEDALARVDSLLEYARTLTGGV
jgi:hypothetical protein